MLRKFPRQFLQVLGAALSGQGLTQGGRVSASRAESEDRGTLAVGPIEHCPWYSLLSISARHGFDQATHMETEENLLAYQGGQFLSLCPLSLSCKLLHISHCTALCFLSLFSLMKSLDTL